MEHTLHLVAAALRAMRGQPYRPAEDPAIRVDDGPNLLQVRVRELLGPAPGERDVRIMVTLPTEAAADPALVTELVSRGMNVRGSTARTMMLRPGGRWRGTSARPPRRPAGRV